MKGVELRRFFLRLLASDHINQQAGAGHPQLFMDIFFSPEQPKDDQAITVLLERNRQAEVLKGL